MLSSKIRLAIGMTMCAIGGAHLGRAQCEAWTPLGDGPRMNTFEFTSWDPDGDGPAGTELVAVGGYGYAGSPFRFIARWDGAAWHPLGPFLVGGGLGAVVLWDPDGDGPLQPRLVVGGYFYNPFDSISLVNVAEWDGNAWQPLGTGTDLTVKALVTLDADGDGPAPNLLIAGGAFTYAGGVRVNGVAAWDGVRWQPLGTGVTADGPYPATVTHLTTCDPDGEGPLGVQLIASGDFTHAGDVAAHNVARWDGTAWHALCDGCTDHLYSLTTWDPDGPGPQARQLVAAGSFDFGGGVSVYGVAVWDGTHWHPLGDAPPHGGSALVTWDLDGEGPLPERLVVAGPARGTDAINPARVSLWDGVAWQTLGMEVNDHVVALGTWDSDGPGPRAPQLLVGGRFTYIGDTAVPGVASWVPCPPPCAGDIDCDGFVTLADIDPFVAHIGCPGPDPATCNTDCAWQNGDLNGDGHVTFADIDPFVARLGATCD